ncbi:RNA polymerase sigma factor, sigma-70 family [Chthonomonas calidirosea]|uniref:RNA polymerase sigma factor, sigma-70 family n=1 Tax=Chthonomonas calidirosea (strain DSM 23976 / ICMP 18418 / T49) TaxID=1303518 RepID=S0EZY2_CHTCT|nr:sigma-70 family RNA polymerase sigma factor [Chthonomonas calidirosea]CCW36160.1 RNA polymerase sigma factor, sigma-70 family [Chthonomonas calidirosea T49]CEK18160.1 RNA polymerase sigma factor, sigma-70 family [Chthonomonas calidirosea]
MGSSFFLSCQETGYDEEKFLLLIRRIAECLARRRKLPPQEVYDCGSEAVLLVLEQLREGETPCLQPQNWIKFVVKVVRNFQRRYQSRTKHEVLLDEGKEELLQLPDTAPTPEAALERKCTESLLYKAIEENLDDSLQAIFLAHFVEHVPLKELAALAGTTPDALCHRLQRARLRVRAWLERHGWDGEIP